MLKLSENNYIVYHVSPTLLDIEFSESQKLNALQKILHKRNKALIANSVLRIGTMLVYNHRDKKQVKQINKCRLQFN